MTGIKLEVCPFCGGEAHILATRDGYIPRCSSCGTCLGDFDAKLTAEAAWNRRAVSEHVEPAPEAGVVGVPEGIRRPDCGMARLSGGYRSRHPRRAADLRRGVD